MALQRFTLTASVTLPQGTAATVVAGEPGTGGAAGFGSFPTTGGPAFPVMLVKGTAIILDTAGPLYTQIGAGNLTAFRDGTDTVGHACLGN